MPLPTSLILLSSGLDSSLALVEALKTTRVAYAITFDYGQVARKAELAHAKKIAKHFHLSHKVISVPIYSQLAKHPLINAALPCPKLTQTQLTNPDKTKKSAKAVWLPNRNGVFLNIAAALAEAEKIQRIYVGFNQEEAKTFPDNSMAFVTNINKCFAYSTLNSVRVFAPAVLLNKIQILKKLMACRGAPMCAPSHEGRTQGSTPTFPLNLIWSCYRGGRKMCGTCESCVRLKRAAKTLHVSVKEFNF